MCTSSRKIEATCPGFSEIFPISSRWFQFQLMSFAGYEHLLPHLEFREHDQKIEEKSHFSLKIYRISLPVKVFIATAHKNVINIV